MGALLSFLLEVFKARGPGSRGQSWLDSRKKTAEFPESRRGLDRGGFQELLRVSAPCSVWCGAGAAWRAAALRSAAPPLLAAGAQVPEDFLGLVSRV